MNSSPTNRPNTGPTLVTATSERRTKIATLLVNAVLLATIPAGIYGFSTLPRGRQGQADKQSQIGEVDREATQRAKIISENPGLKEQSTPTQDSEVLTNQAIDPDTLSE